MSIGSNVRHLKRNGGKGEMAQAISSIPSSLRVMQLISLAISGIQLAQVKKLF